MPLQITHLLITYNAFSVWYLYVYTSKIVIPCFTAVNGIQYLTEKQAQTASKLGRDEQISSFGAVLFGSAHCDISGQFYMDRDALNRLIGAFC